MNRVPLWRKIGYGAGGLGFDLAFNITSFYQIFFLTSIVAIPPAQAGLLVGLPSMILTPLTPFAGYLSDRMHSRLGRRLLISVCGPLGGLLFFLKFFALSGMAIQTLVIYWWLVQLASSANGGLLGVSYDALGAELSPSSAERVQMVSIRQSFGIIGALSGSSLPLLVASVFGNGLTGFAWMGAAFGTLVAASFLIVGATATRGSLPPRQPSSVWREILITSRLRPFWFQFAIAFLSQMAVVVTNATLIFYLSYVHGVANLLPLIMLLVTATALASLPLLTWLSRRWDTRWAFAIGILVYTAVLFSLRFIPSGNTVWLWTLVSLAGLGVGALNIFPKSMITDVAAYDHAKQGRSRAGNVMGLWSLGGGGGTALGSALAGWLLALVGYHSGAEVSFGLQEGLRSIIAFVPSALLLVALPLIALSLSRADMIQVEATLRRD